MYKLGGTHLADANIEGVLKNTTLVGPADFCQIGSTNPRLYIDLAPV